MPGSRRKRHGASGGGGENWLTTYGDMVTLLLCFFVVLFSFSSLDVTRFRAIMAAFQGAVGVLDSGRAAIPDTAVGGADSVDAQWMIRTLVPRPEARAILERLEAMQALENLEEGLTVEVDERGIVIHFADRVLFDLGEAVLKPEAERVLRRLAVEVIGAWPGHIRVEGHTDNLPIANLRYPSNWELSTARAARVVRFLIAEGGFDPGRLSAAGYAEFRPIASNATEEGRARNRRVDIVLLSSENSAPEPAAALSF